jgi:hypothetical protein
MPQRRSQAWYAGPDQRNNYLHRAAGYRTTLSTVAAAHDRIKQAVDAVNGADIALLKAGLSLQGLPAGPTRVALDQPTPAQLETLRTAVQGST